MRLGPLRFGHVRVLTALHCTAPLTWNQLHIALLIVSQEVAALPATLAMIRDGRRDRAIDKWLRRSMRECNLNVECAAFAAWYQYHVEPPEVVSRSERCAPEPCVMPFHQHMRSVLLAKLNYDPAQIDAAPYAQAIMDYYGYLEAEGVVRVLRHTSSERQAMMREFQAN